MNGFLLQLEKTGKDMSHFFVTSNQVSGEILTILGDDVNHMKNVLRMRTGEAFTAADENGVFYPDTQMVGITINVKKANLKVGTFKAKGNYNFSIKEGGLVTLKGSGSHYDKYTLMFERLKDANIKGIPNTFNTSSASLVNLSN